MGFFCVVVLACLATGVASREVRTRLLGGPKEEPEPSRVDDRPADKEDVEALKAMLNSLRSEVARSLKQNEGTILEGGRSPRPVLNPVESLTAIGGKDGPSLLEDDQAFLSDTQFANSAQSSTFTCGLSSCDDA